MSVRGILASFRFECSRSLSVSRLAWWSCMAVFPAVLLFLIRQEEPEALRDAEGFAVILYFLIVRVLCPLNLLLLAAPIIHSELEGKTWFFLAVRPHGKSSVLFGKYFAAVAWTIAGGWLSLALAIAIGPPEEVTRVAWVLGRLVVLSSFAYGAVYTLLGVLFLKRAMVVTVGYTLLVEGVLTVVPAVVNEVTVAFRLRTIGVAEFDLASRAEPLRRLISDGSTTEQVAILAVYAISMLSLALLALRRRQLVLARED